MIERIIRGNIQKLRGINWFKTDFNPTKDILYSNDELKHINKEKKRKEKMAVKFNNFLYKFYKIYDCTSFGNIHKQT
jgi:hypothetical protein